MSADATPAGAPTRLFTVGIPVFNGRALLRNCLESVVGSSMAHERFEVLGEGGGPGVLGLEVGDHLGVVLVAQPLVRVVDHVAVVLADEGSPVGHRGLRGVCRFVCERRSHDRPP